MPEWEDLAAFERFAPSELIERAVEDFFPRVGLTCSLSAEDVVLAHTIQGIEPRVPIIFIDTGYHFEETLRLRDELTRLLGWNLVEYRPELTVEEQARRYGPGLFSTQPDLCCGLRKVEPMRRALKELDVWITGLRRTQSPTRAGISKVERHGVEGGRQLLKLNPLADWDTDRVWDYIRANGLPYNALYNDGYASIGCEPCTDRVAAGEHERAGRWRGAQKTECGLHTFTQRK